MTRNVEAESVSGGELVPVRYLIVTATTAACLELKQKRNPVTLKFVLVSHLK